MSGEFTGKELLVEAEQHLGFAVVGKCQCQPRGRQPRAGCAQFLDTQLVLWKGGNMYCLVPLLIEQTAEFSSYNKLQGRVLKIFVKKLPTQES